MIPHTQAAANWLKAQPPGIAKTSHVAALQAYRRRMFVMAAEIASVYGLTVEDFKSPCRKRGVVWPRQEFMLAAQREGFSLPQIGRFLNRDHTTILWGIAQAKRREKRWSKHLEAAE
jgi:chromosomal replication initiation ATPase DnaA